MSDDRDLVIQDLSRDNLRLETALAEALQDRDTFRTLLSEALTRLRACEAQREKADSALKRAMGHPDDPLPTFQPWYPAPDDPTDTSQMVHSREIRWT